MGTLKRELSNPLTEDEAKSLTRTEKEWLRSWNRHDEIPGEEAPGGEDDEDTSGAVDYNDLTKDELKEELRSRDLPVSGNHDELVARLEEDDESDEEDDDSDDE